MAAEAGDRCVDHAVVTPAQHRVAEQRGDAHRPLHQLDRPGHRRPRAVAPRFESQPRASLEVTVDAGIDPLRRDAPAQLDPQPHAIRQGWLDDAVQHGARHQPAALDAESRATSSTTTRSGGRPARWPRPRPAGRAGRRSRRGRSRRATSRDAASRELPSTHAERHHPVPLARRSDARSTLRRHRRRRRSRRQCRRHRVGSRRRPCRPRRQSAFPRDTACGDLVGPRGVAVLAELALDPPSGRPPPRGRRPDSTRRVRHDGAVQVAAGASARSAWASRATAVPSKKDGAAPA